jgi:hypothetical protein
MPSFTIFCAFPAVPAALPYGMPTATLTVDLPAEELQFLQAYAREHGVSAAEVVTQYVQRLKNATRPAIHPEVSAITGLVPQSVDAQEEYRKHLLEKHQ